MPKLSELPSWRELFPCGRTIYYEGHDPEGFVDEIKDRFGFDPSADNPGWELWVTPDGFVPADGILIWNGTELGWFSYSFHCPPEHLDAIYNDYNMGS